MGTKSNLLMKKGAWRENINLQKIAPVLILLCMVVVLSLANDQFLQLATFSNLFQSVAPVGIVAIGAMCVIITGGIDFSAGYGLAVAGVSAGVLYAKSDFNIFVLFATGLAVGLLIGLINGLVITVLKMPPFVATLAMMSVLQGFALLISQGQRLLIEDPAALWIGQKVFGNFMPASFLLFLGICVVGHLLLTRSKFGLYLYAMGGNEDAITYAGVNVAKYKTLVYVFAGFCFGVGSCVTISRVALISPNISGTILMDAIASAIIGGTSVSGGKGTVFGTIIGTLIMGLISTTLTYLNVDILLRDAVKGGIIILALMLDVLANKVNEKRASA